MNSAPRLITFDLDDTLWEVRPALQAAEQAQWSFLASRFPDLHLDSAPRETLDTIRRTVLTKEPALAHRISLFRERFIDALLQSHGVTLRQECRKSFRGSDGCCIGCHAVTLQ